MQSGVLFDLDETLVDRRGTLLDYAQVLHSQLSHISKSGYRSFCHLSPHWITMDKPRARNSSPEFLHLPRIF
jgi:phosphoglycolate phosphatase-like HAD superfamily hydrolase